MKKYKLTNKMKALLKNAVFEIDPYQAHKIEYNKRKDKKEVLDITCFANVKIPGHEDVNENMICLTTFLRILETNPEYFEEIEDEN